MMAGLLRDLRFGARTFLRAPGFTSVAILTIAVGVGATTAVFSVVDAVLLRPLPYPRADELVVVSNINRQTRQGLGDATPANFLDWRVRNRTFAALTAQTVTSLTLSGFDTAEHVDGAMVTSNFFDVLDVKPVLGRAFAEADERPGADRVAVISDGMWRRRFGARANIVGETIRLNDEPTTIVGVMPEGVEYPDKAEIWVAPHWRVPDDPLLGPTQDPSSERTHGYIIALGRLKRGVGVEQAQADMDAVARSLERDFPNDLQNVGVRIEPLRADLVGGVGAMVTLLFAAVAILLLIAVANVSGLLMARAAARRHEIAIRTAIGASRRQIVAQLLSESMLLAMTGGAGGVLLTMWLVGPLVRLSPDSLTVAGEVSIDPRVLIFALGVSVGAGLLFGLAPARQLARTSVHDDLKQSSRGGSASGDRRLRAAFVAAEVALSLMLLVGAGLTIRSFVRLQQVSTGFDIDGIVTTRLSPSPLRYRDPRKRADFYDQAISALRAVPAVQAAGAVSRLPLAAGNSARGLTIPGVPADVPTGADYRTASPDYFRAMGIPLLQGRGFTEDDREGRPLVALVSASLAKRFWPNQNPIGAHFSINDPEITIVGVVGDVHGASVDAPVQPTVYVPYRQDPFPFMTLVARSSAPSGVVSAAIRAAVARVDRNQPVGEVRTMDAQLSHSFSRRRFAMTLLTAFGTTATGLAAIGLYGVLAFVVTQRRREIGLRMALGATRSEVVRDVVWQGMKVALAGVAIGLGLAAAAGRVTATLLFATSPTDLATYAAASVLLVAVAAAASAVPAFRASRVDPIATLREY